MFFDFRVYIPKILGKIVITTQQNTKYIYYEYDRIYKPNKKYNIPKRTIIGKQCEDDDTMMYPNTNFLKYFPETEILDDAGRSERSSCLRIGAVAVIKKVIEDYNLDEMIYQIIGKDTGLFLDLVAYTIIAENNAGQYYPDYAYSHPLFSNKMKIYGDSKVSKFLSCLSKDQSIKFLNEWNTSRDHRERIYISYDSTNKTCQAGEVELAEYGYSKDGIDKPVFNYAIAFDRNNREPLFYEEYPGSIVDVSQLQYMIEKAVDYGYRRVGFILDRGYFSKENISCMDKSGYDFVIMVKGMKKLVKEIIHANKGHFEEKRDNSIRTYKTSGITMRKKLFATDTKKRYFHVYYKSQKYTAEREQLEAKIDRMSKYLKEREGKSVILNDTFEKYFDLIYYHKGQEDQKFLYGKEKTDIIDEEIKLCGYFVIITSAKMTAKEALELYKSRDESEKLFRGDKSYLGNRSMRVHSDETINAKIFVEFVALIVRNKIYTCLKDAMEENEKKSNYMTVPAALKELEKIEVIGQMGKNYHLDHAVSATQKTILKAFGVEGVLFIKQYVKRINEKIEEKVTGKS
jgi:transposase